MNEYNFFLMLFMSIFMLIVSYIFLLQGIKKTIEIKGRFSIKTFMKLPPPFIVHSVILILSIMTLFIVITIYICSKISTIGWDTEDIPVVIVVSNYLILFKVSFDFGVGYNMMSNKINKTLNFERLMFLIIMEMLCALSILYLPFRTTDSIIIYIFVFNIATIPFNGYLVQSFSVKNN